MSNHNPKKILENVNNYIAELEAKPYKWGRRLKIEDVYSELGIFDWWHEYLSLSQLKQMRAFLNVAIKYGYTGYACFKVGAAGCAHGMWANKKESTNGFSPDGAELHHSFRSGDNYWCIKDDNEQWLDRADGSMGYYSTKELKAIMEGGK